MSQPTQQAMQPAAAAQSDATQAKPQPQFIRLDIEPPKDSSNLGTYKQIINTNLIDKITLDLKGRTHLSIYLYKRKKRETVTLKNSFEEVCDLLCVDKETILRLAD